MATTSVPVPVPGAAPQTQPVYPGRHRISSAEYMRMAEAGVFSEATKIELIEGEILDMSPQGNPHRLTIMRWTRVLVRVAGADNCIQVQSTLPLAEGVIPESDLAVLRGREEDYLAKGRAIDVLLVVEVAETSLAFDSREKAALYGRHGVPQTIVVDLPHRRLLSFTEPSEMGYLRSEPLVPGEQITLSALNVTVSVADLLL